jgi:hypothetical protein
MNDPSLTHSDGGDAFQVMFSAGELRVLSLDELDEAFNAGKVDERTFVLAPGTTEWARLGDLLGIETAPEAPAPVAAAPLSYVPQRPAPQAAPLPTVIVAAPQAPQVSSIEGGAFSTRPVAFDLDDDLSEQHLRPKRRAPVVVALAMVALGVGGFFAYRTASAPSDAAMTAAAAAAAVPVAPPVTTPTITPTVPVAAPIDDNHRVVLTDDQKRALAAADKAHATKAASQHAARAATATHSSGKHSKEKVFHNGGSAYDPLNGSL